jgi:hypothetical protein
MTGSIAPERSANEIWADAAHAVLQAVAADYGAVITAKDLGIQVQQQSGVPAGPVLQRWINPVLGEVAARCQVAGDPPLISLVVNKTDGRVGAAYDAVVSAQGLPAPADNDSRDQLAAQSRQECYQRYCDSVPSSARPMLSPTLQAALDKERKLRKSMEQVPRCPTCNVELSRTGICDSCDM